jgi:hypothetical protein
MLRDAVHDRHNRHAAKDEEHPNERALFLGFRMGRALQGHGAVLSGKARRAATPAIAWLPFAKLSFDNWYYQL